MVSRFLSALLLVASCAAAEEWKISDESPAQPASSPLVLQRWVITKPGETGFFSKRTIDIVWFDSATHTFRVIDNGSSGAGKFPSLAAAMRANECLAGCNGGFFQKNNDPLGLMIAAGESTGGFGTGSSLVSGVVLSSGNRNPYLLRRAEYDSGTYRPTDLIQTGPFLVDQGATVRGLSPENSRRRTFVLHDGEDGFAIGTSDAFTLAELGQILASPDFSPGRRIHRAINLDGGTSSGFYLDRGSDISPIHIEPIKTVRNFLGIVPRG